MSNRLTDAYSTSITERESLPPLPVIDWSKIGRSAPENVDLGNPSEKTSLPKADYVVITWTSAEWSALDHVFCNSDQIRYRTSTEFRDEWHYRKDDQGVKDTNDLWGYYRMVRVKDKNGKPQDVLLFKSTCHLAHPPFIEGLMAMVKMIIKEAAPEKLYTIGTAGGTSASEALGDTVITQTGRLSLDKSVNKESGLNDKEVRGHWFPSLDLLSSVEQNLLFKLDTVVNRDELDHLFSAAAKKSPSGSQGVAVDDMVNSAIDPDQLSAPKGLNKKDIPLLTTDYYYIATGNDARQYCVLEMDDAVVGYIAEQAKVDFLFVRNISDPIVPANTRSGQPIDNDFRDNWSGEVYSSFGLYTSMNGALVTWATIAGNEK